LFNWLGQDLSGWRCLDAFAGSGALGFEAASRGAAEVVLIENDAQLARSLRASRERLAVTTLQVEVSDALGWMKRCAPERFELILLDPPFDGKLLAPSIAAASRLLAPGGFIYTESPAALADWPADLASWRDDRAGAVWFRLLQRAVVAVPVAQSADAS
jgi:16S rRNA (guanine(966)-N(2))-methyltransferase RsmD